jgi:5-formyltetrahydrofolate cyclo-ligase
VDFSEDDCQAQDLVAAKRRIRVASAKAVDELSRDEKVRLSEQIRAHVAHSSEFASARTIAMYCALESEVDLADLMQAALDAGRDVVLPVTDTEGHSIRFVSVEDPLRDLAVGALGIMEPRRGMPLNDVSHLDLVLVPGRAFDASGGRLGRGGGYYDGMLSRMRPRAAGGPAKLGICYGCQMVAAVPMEPRDVRVDGVATERGATWVRA